MDTPFRRSENFVACVEVEIGGKHMGKDETTMCLVQQSPTTNETLCRLLDKESVPGLMKSFLCHCLPDDAIGRDLWNTETCHVSPFRIWLHGLGNTAKENRTPCLFPQITCNIHGTHSTCTVLASHARGLRPYYGEEAGLSGTWKKVYTVLCEIPSEYILYKRPKFYFLPQFVF